MTAIITTTATISVELIGVDGEELVLDEVVEVVEELVIEDVGDEDVVIIDVPQEDFVVAAVVCSTKPNVSSIANKSSQSDQTGMAIFP